jgi:mRNA interferase MazF
VQPPPVVDPGEIYWGEDPTAIGSEQKGDRLWLVMSRRTLNGNNTVVVIPLTSKTEKAVRYKAFCILLPAGEILPDPGEKPSVPSVALCHQLRVFDKTRFRRRYGKLSLSAIPSVQLGLSFVFNL